MTMLNETLDELRAAGVPDDMLAMLLPEAQFVMFIPSTKELRTRSQNELMGYGRFGYEGERVRWAKAFIAAMAEGKIPQAVGKRRVVFTRVYCGQEKPRDYGNLVGGLKPVVDAMHPSKVRTLTRGKRKGKTVNVLGAGLIVDDTPRFLVDVYLQERSNAKRSGLRVEVCDVPESVDEVEDAITQGGIGS